LRLQCFSRAGLYALHAQDAFRTIEPFPGVVRHVHIHGARLPALSAGDALFLIAGYPEQGKTAQKSFDLHILVGESTEVQQQGRDIFANSVIASHRFYPGTAFVCSTNWKLLIF